MVAASFRALVGVVLALLGPGWASLQARRREFREVLS